MKCRRLEAELTRLAQDRRGAMVIETAFVAPILLLLALGGFEISQIVSRQHELQSGVAEAEAVALAANAGAKTDVEDLKSILMESLSLSEDQVQVEKLYRCDADEGFVETKESCPEDAVVSSYVRITLEDDYKPIWTQFGVKKDFAFNVVRTVQLS